MNKLPPPENYRNRERDAEWTQSRNGGVSRGHIPDGDAESWLSGADSGRIYLLRYGHGNLKGGLYDGEVAPTITTSSWECNNFLIEPIMESEETAKVMQVGNIMPDDGRRFDNPQVGRVYSADGISPTLDTMGGGNREPKIVEPINTTTDGISPTITAHYHKVGWSDLDPTCQLPHIAIVERYKNKHVQKMVESGRIDPTKVQYLDTYNQIVREDVASTISTRTDANNDCYVTEPQTLTQRRTEEGRELRKQGVDVFAHKNLVPREDGVSGTLTSVQKDNLLAEPNRGVFYKGRRIADGAGLYTDTTDEFFRGGLSDVSRTLKAETHDAGVCCGYRIRKLTPKECFRLMDVSEEDIDKIQSAGISKSAQYRLAGNSIVVAPLYYIFKELFITKTEPIQGTLF